MSIVDKIHKTFVIVGHLIETVIFLFAEALWEIF